MTLPPLEGDAPAAMRRGLSAVLAASLLVLLACSLVSAISSYVERRDEIAQLRASVAALAASARPPDPARPLPSPDAALRQALAQTPDAGINHVQKVVRTLNEVLGANDVQIDSVRLLPPFEEGALTASRASVALTTSHRQVFDIVNVIEASTPAIVIDAIRISNRTNNTMPHGEATTAEAVRMAIKVNMTLRVYAPTPARALRNPDTTGGNSSQKVSIP